MSRHILTNIQRFVVDIKLIVKISAVLVCLTAFTLRDCLRIPLLTNFNFYIVDFTFCLLGKPITKNVSRNGTFPHA